MAAGPADPDPGGADAAVRSRARHRPPSRRYAGAGGPDLAQAGQGHLRRRRHIDPTLAYARIRLVVAGPNHRRHGDPPARRHGDGRLPAAAADGRNARPGLSIRSEEHTSELQSLMRISYAVLCLQKNNNPTSNTTYSILHRYTY